ncbi:MAG: pyridoxine 5'-phosphate synthase [Candidatus Cloacimonetes bacterium]|jgi:pyridoxine 5-phosphate synthase|nr:pyridoxine 5'-phosphate synthase [Candidatus Cloacimonadota bacterium]MBT6994358.1 pyridoxine 5'-phosphate synthase [Candidatus Cloacimonadota bacterium]
MPELGVNIDHIATLRQARMGIEPDPILAAAIAEKNGADQITIHLREDRRHIQDRDLQILRKTVQTRLNLEMAATDEMIETARKILPDTVTLVPEKREELTTEGGLFLTDKHEKLIRRLKEVGIEVSVFIEPDLELIKFSKKIGVDAVEIHTGKYANLIDETEIETEFVQIKNAANLVKKLGMRVVAGHGLNYENIQKLIKLDVIEEYNIGHSIISRAVFSGLAEAIKEMKRIIGDEN